MRKINFLLVSLLVVASGFFASCSKDEDTDGPVISFSNDLTSATLQSGVTEYEINGNITSIAGLDEVKFFQVTSAGEDQIGSAVTSFTDKNDYDFKFKVTNVVEETVIKISATDKNNVSNSRNFTIKVASTTIPTGDKLISYTGTMAAQLGANLSSFGSAYSTSTGAVYLKSAAKANQSKVDFIYFYSTTASVGAEIISPKYAETNYTDYVTGWTTKNDTKFKATNVTATEFDNIVNTDETLVVSSASSVTDQRIVDLAVGDVFAFVTGAGKKGLAKVKALTATTSGSITIEVKVQK
jgi:hypothetical protein